jgi:putative two-component system protein, hydrogenase maturation factor HypX/HoxX
MLSTRRRPPVPGTDRRVLLLADGFGGMTMAAYTRLRDLGAQVCFRAPTGPEDMLASYRELSPDLVFAPTLTKRVPEELYGRVVINHPGRLGDRGPSSIDWARLRGERLAGHTLLAADEGWDEGPVLTTETIRYPDDPALTKSWLYSRLHRAATLRGLETLLTGDPHPTPLDGDRPAVLGTWNNPVKQKDVGFDWALSADEIVRLVAARDGAPGVLVDLLGAEAYAYDVHHGGPAPRGTEPGAVVETLPDGAVRVAVGPTGDGERESVWVGCLKTPGTADRRTFKLPAAWWVHRRVPQPVSPAGSGRPFRPVRVECPDETTAVVTAGAYNGAWSTGFCHRVDAALRAVLDDPAVDTVLFRGGGRDPFGNGIHLNHIYGSDPMLGAAMEREARENIRAINQVCERFFDLRRAGKRVIILVDGDAGAGGAFLALCGDLVIADPTVNLNPHYVGMGGLHGSEHHTWTLRQRVPDADTRHALLTECLPVSAQQAHRMGLVDEVAPGGLDAADLGEWALDVARRYTSLAAQGRVSPPPPPSRDEQDATAETELAAIDEDFGDPGFQAALTRFVLKLPGEPPVGPAAAGEYRGAYRD